MQVQFQQLNTSYFSVFCMSSVRELSPKSMEGKGLKRVIMCVLILGLLVEQIQVEGKSCCPTTAKRNCYNICRIGDKIPRSVCASTCGCKIVDGKCPDGWKKFNLVPNAEEAIVSEYCKLGCASSVCDAMSTAVGSEAQKDVVEPCNNACSRLCTKDVEIAMVDV